MAKRRIEESELEDVLVENLNADMGTLILPDGTRICYHRAVYNADSTAEFPIASSRVSVCVPDRQDLNRYPTTFFGKEMYRLVDNKYVDGENPPIDKQVYQIKNGLPLLPPVPSQGRENKEIFSQMLQDRRMRSN